MVGEDQPGERLAGGLLGEEGGAIRANADGTFTGSVQIQDGTESDTHDSLEAAVRGVILGARVLNNARIHAGDIDYVGCSPPPGADEPALPPHADWKDGEEGRRLRDDDPPTRAELRLLRELRRGAVVCLEHTDPRLRGRLRVSEVEAVQAIREGRLVAAPAAAGPDELATRVTVDDLATLSDLARGAKTLVDSADYHEFRRWQRYHGRESSNPITP